AKTVVLMDNRFPRRKAEIAITVVLKARSLGVALVKKS
ncbi:unnamed protein product, partial [marine sediment metagenome]